MNPQDDATKTTDPTSASADATPVASPMTDDTMAAGGTAQTTGIDQTSTMAPTEETTVEPAEPAGVGAPTTPDEGAGSAGTGSQAA